MWRERERGAPENKRLRGGGGPHLSWSHHPVRSRHVSEAILDTPSSVIMPHMQGSQQQAIPKLQNHKPINVCFRFKSLSFGMVCYAANDRLKSTLPHFDLTGKFALWFYISTQIHKGWTTLISDTGYMQREKMLRKKTAELGRPVSLKLNQII